MKNLLIIVLAIVFFKAYAAEPLFTLTPQGTLPTTVSSTGTATANYTVTNNTPYTLQDNGLTYPPGGQTPFGVTQNTTATSSPATCDDPFTLSPGQSCTLVLTISGADLINGQAMGGPQVCNTKENPARCSVPIPANQLSVRLKQPPAISLVGGGGSSGGQHAFLVQSVNGGGDWTLSDLPSLAASKSRLYSTASTVGLSIAVGSAEDFLILQSIDGGTTWMVATLPDVGGNNAALISSTCTSSRCLAIGYDDSGAPILYQTLDFGTSWVIPSISGSTALDGFNSVTCVSDLCIIPGGGSSGNPLVAYSPSGSQNWLQSDTSSLTTNGYFYAGACASLTLCLGVGADVSVSDQPLLAISRDGGASFQPFNLYTSTLPSLYEGELDAASCNADICIAVGYNDDGSQSPLLIQSTDNGVTWTLIDLTTVPVVPIIGGTLFASSCSDPVCVVVGNDGTGTPVIVEATNIAGTWTWESIDLSGIFTSGNLVTASCDGTYCIAAGINSNAPILLERSDVGVWSQVIVPGTPNNGQYYGGFATALKRSL